MKIIVIGSGPSGIHFTLTALRKGHHVTMLDVGHKKPQAVLPDQDFIGLKKDLDDPVSYFLGEEYNAISLPSTESDEEEEYYGLPPSKDYVFDLPEQFSYAQDGLAPLVSFASGGLAESWTAGSYPLNEAELSAFPFGEADMQPHYSEIAQRIGIGGEQDDLSNYYPPHDHLSQPIELDTSGRLLLQKYERQRQRLTKKHKARLGRSRQAALTFDKDERKACTKCGRCLWGCPNGAFYTPSLTLKECLSFETFTYIPNRYISHFDLNSEGTIQNVIAFDVEVGAETKYSADAYVLAGGTLGSSHIVLRSVYKSWNEIIRLTGLMDNRQVLAPFFNLAMLGKDYNPNSYQYHQLAVGFETDQPEHYIHGQITTLKTATAHPVLQSLPLDFKSAMKVFSALRSGLGVVNLNFSDYRRETNYLTLGSLGSPSGRVSGRIESDPSLYIRYRPRLTEAGDVKAALKRAGRLFADLGAPLIPGMAHIRPMGASVHYSGTMPMSDNKQPWAVSPNCQSYDFDNLFIVDGAVMPFLPAKNLTFTLMANAVRVATNAF